MKYRIVKRYDDFIVEKLEGMIVPSTILGFWPWSKWEERWLGADSQGVAVGITRAYSYRTYEGAKDAIKKFTFVNEVIHFDSSYVEEPKGLTKAELMYIHKLVHDESIEREKRESATMYILLENLQTKLQKLIQWENSKTNMEKPE